MDWLKLAEKALPEYLAKTCELLKVPTVLQKYNEEDLDAPFGVPIRQALDLMLAYGESDGFQTKNIENYAGHIEMGDGEEVLGILGHLDVVPAGGKWNYPPFGAIIENGKVYSRGAMDDKGPTMAAYIAMKLVKASGIPLSKKVRLILGCDEESGMRCIKKYLEVEKMPDLGFAPDAEFPLIYGEKGIYSFDIVGDVTDDLIVSLQAGDRYNVVPDVCEAVLRKDLSSEFLAYLKDHDYQGEVKDNKYTIYGKNAHAAWPHMGVNAIFLMIDFLKRYSEGSITSFIDRYLLSDTLGKKLGISHYDEEMKELTLNLAKIDYCEGEFRVGCNIRYPKGYDFSEGHAMISRAAGLYDLSVVDLGNSPYHYVSPDDELVQKLHHAYIKYTGDDKSPLITIGGGTYARKLKKAVAFGPSFPGQVDLAHQPMNIL